MCLEKAVKSRKRGNAGHGFYSSTLITHNSHHGRARGSSSSRIHGCYYAIIHAQNVGNPHEDQEGKIVKSSLETSFACGLRGCRLVSKAAGRPGACFPFAFYSFH